MKVRHLFKVATVLCTGIVFAFVSIVTALPAMADDTHQIVVQPYSATMGGYYTVSVNGGEAVNGTAYITNRVAVGESITIEITPNAGKQFLYWCRGVSPAIAKDASITFRPTADRILVPIVRAYADPCTRTWNSNLASEKKNRPWYTDSYWSPSGCPGPEDDVVFDKAGGSYGYDFIAMKSLTINDAANLRIGVENGGDNKYVATDVNSEYFVPYTTGDHADIAVDISGDAVLGGGCQFGVGCVNNTEFETTFKVGGNLTFADGGKLYVFAGCTNEVRSLATGVGFITVGGALAITNGTIYAYSEPYTGGSVKITAGSVDIRAEGAVRADCTGYKYFPNSDPTTCCPGAHGAYGGETYNGGGVYGFLASPVHPGSGNRYNTNLVRGGGLIRIHSAGTFSFAGLLSATSENSSGYAGTGSGGGIWVTAADFVFGAGARVDVSVGHVTSAKYSGGGRVAFAKCTDAGALASFAATGGAAGYKTRSLAKFREIYGAALDVDLSHGTSRDYTDDRERCNGTFAWVERAPGLVLIFR